MSAVNLVASKAAFRAAHQARYGLLDETRAVEAVTLRLRVRRAANLPDESAAPDSSHAASATDFKMVWFVEGARQTALFEREKLRPGARFDGLCLVFQFDTTIVVPPRWSARVDGRENLWLFLNVAH